jgi:hypothetical protein
LDPNNQVSNKDMAKNELDVSYASSDLLDYEVKVCIKLDLPLLRNSEQKDNDFLNFDQSLIYNENKEFLNHKKISCDS